MSLKSNFEYIRDWANAKFLEKGSATPEGLWISGSGKNSIIKGNSIINTLIETFKNEIPYTSKELYRTAESVIGVYLKGSFTVIEDLMKILIDAMSSGDERTLLMLMFALSNVNVTINNAFSVSQQLYDIDESSILVYCSEEEYNNIPESGFFKIDLNIASGNDSLSIFGTASGDNSVAINGGEASGFSSVAIAGKASGEGSISIGNTGEASGTNSINIGGLNEASGEGSIAIGDNAFSLGRGAIAIHGIAHNGSVSICGESYKGISINGVSAGTYSVATAFSNSYYIDYERSNFFSSNNQIRGIALYPYTNVPKIGDYVIYTEGEDYGEFWWEITDLIVDDSTHRHTITIEQKNYLNQQIFIPEQVYDHYRVTFYSGLTLGEKSFNSGIGTVTLNPGENSSGSYNKSNQSSVTFGDSGNTISSVGIGSQNDRKNALEVMQNGDIYVIGLGNYNGKNVSSSNSLQQYLDNNNQLVSEALNSLDGRTSTLENIPNLFEQLSLDNSEKILVRNNINAASNSDLLENTTILNNMSSIMNTMQARINTLSGTNSFISWDGKSVPNIANIPSGITVEYEGSEYVGTLAASSDTLNTIYYIGDESSDAKTRYITITDGTNYYWINLGSTDVNMIDYVRKDSEVWLTQEEFDSLAVKDPNVTYNVYEEEVTQWSD